MFLNSYLTNHPLKNKESKPLYIQRHLHKIHVVKCFAYIQYIYIFFVLFCFLVWQHHYFTENVPNMLADRGSLLCIWSQSVSPDS